MKKYLSMFLLLIVSVSGQRPEKRDAIPSELVDAGCADLPTGQAEHAVLGSGE